MSDLRRSAKNENEAEVFSVITAHRSDFLIWINRLYSFERPASKFGHEDQARRECLFVLDTNLHSRVPYKTKDMKTTEPNQALQTMTTAVTDCAAHTPRQLRSCLI
jgi:hypothetical protein